MANFKRKRPKEYTTRYCGYRHCIQDKGKFRGNGRERYLPAHWKILGGRHVWRYTHKNVERKGYEQEYQ